MQVQTLKHLYEAPLFEGIESEDCKYSLLYSENNQQLLLIYQTNIIAVYDADTGEVQSIVQAATQYNIVCPIIVQAKQQGHMMEDDSNKKESDSMAFMSVIEQN